MLPQKYVYNKKLNALQNSASGNPYIDLLARTGEVLHSINSEVINNIAFSNDTLSLAITTKNFSDLHSIVGMLKRKGLKVSQQNAKTIDNKVSATINIKE